MSKVQLKLHFHRKYYTVFQKGDAKIQITITMAYLIRIKYSLSGFNYHLSHVNFGVTFYGTQCISKKLLLFFLMLL